MIRRIPALETERLIIRELTMDDLESINTVLNKSFGWEMPMGERQRWLQFWAIAPAHQHKGFALEAGRALVEYLFTHEKLGRIIATTDYENLPSQKVMQKLGMTIQHLEEPQLPDKFVVGVLENNTL